jgi:hypothetical protein
MFQHVKKTDVRRQLVGTMRSRLDVDRIVN